MSAQLQGSNFYANSPGLHKSQIKDNISPFVENQASNNNPSHFPFSGNPQSNNQASMFQPSPLIQTQSLTNPNQQTFPMAQGNQPGTNNVFPSGNGSNFGGPGQGISGGPNEPSFIPPKANLEESVGNLLKIFKGVFSLSYLKLSKIPF